MATNNAGRTVTTIGQDTHITGEMRFTETARILGKLDGSISSEGEVQIGPDARCAATIEAARVVIEGEIEGDVRATERLELLPTARVTGDLVARTLVVAEGATFTGLCTVGSDALNPKAGSRTHIAAESKPVNDTKAEIKADPKSDLKAGLKGDLKSDAKPEPKPELKPAADVSDESAPLALTGA